MREKRSVIVRTMKSSNRQRLFLREFIFAGSLHLLLIVHHTQCARRLVRAGVADSPKDVGHGRERIGDVTESSRVGAQHVEELFTRGEQKGEGATAAEVDVVGERGEELLAGG